MGNREGRIMFYHLLPNCFPPVVVQATLAMGFAILTVAALSFIGLGIQPPMSEWGAMTAEGASYIVSGEWWLFLFPGLAIMVTVLAFNLVGDTTWCKGRVAAKREDGGEKLVDLDIWGENQRQEVTTKGTATVRLPSRQVGP
jgi:ABC-type antimicrobial peptide transport system permease subunit